MKKNSELRLYKKWEYLFKSNKKDTNIYFVVSWRIVLKKNKSVIVYIEKDELLWEKSLSNINQRSTDAQAVENCKVLVLTAAKLKKLWEKEKVDLYVDIMLYISKRVDHLNSILNYVKSLSEVIFEYNWWTDIDAVKDVFGIIYKIKKFLILKYEYGSLSRIVWDVILNDEIEKNAILFSENKETICPVKNNLYIMTKEYIIYLEWKIAIDQYVANNVFLYIIPMLFMLVSNIEKEKNDLIAKQYNNHY